MCEKYTYAIPVSTPLPVASTDHVDMFRHVGLDGSMRSTLESPDVVPSLGNKHHLKDDTRIGKDWFAYCMFLLFSLGGGLENVLFIPQVWRHDPFWLQVLDSVASNLQTSGMSADAVPRSLFVEADFFGRLSLKAIKAFKSSKIRCAHKAQNVSPASRRQMIDVTE